MPTHITLGFLSLMHVLAEAKGVKLPVEYPRRVPQTIRTDPVRLRQILVNLSANVIKFTEVGEVRLTIWVKDDADRIEFNVCDTGIGMNAEQVDSLFQPFVQADASMNRRFGGIAGWRWRPVGVWRIRSAAMS
jgi:signal transduction histidine kinase